MYKGLIGSCLAIVAFAATTTTHAAVHRVYPGESIQGAIDSAAPGDTVLVEPGAYQEADNGRYGLRISTDNLRIIGKVKKGRGEAGKVRLLQYQDQETGIYAAPAGCDYDVKDDTDEGQECRGRELQGVYIRGFTVEDFPKNGIQTRWVDGFEFVRNESARNGWDNGNGIYPTLSANGLVRNNVSYGSTDTAMWVAGSENVRVIGNELYGSVIGFEITVSNNVEVVQNEIYNNTLGIGLFHPNAAGNPPLSEMENWVVEHNDVYDNNLPNAAPPNSFQADLPSGGGILLLGASNHVIAKNNVEDNDFFGVAVLGWCTSQFFAPPGCFGGEPALLGDPSANNVLVAQNTLYGNGNAPPANPLAPLAADIIYLVTPAVGEPGTGNCFEKNKPKKDFTFSSFLNGPPGAPFFGEPADSLPNDGC